MDAAIDYVLRSPAALFGAIGVGSAILGYQMTRKWFAVPVLALLGMVLTMGGLYGLLVERDFELLAALAFGLGFLFLAWCIRRRPQASSEAPDAEQFGTDLKDLIDPD